MFYRTILLSAVAAVSSLAEDGANGQWRNWGGDAGSTKYSPLDQINADNFASLEIAWRWESISKSVSEADPRVRPGEFKPTPLMIDGVLYLPTEVCQVVALDAGTGALLWSFDPKSYEFGRPANVGFQHRGLSYWTDGNEKRLFLATHDRKLVAIDANTGTPCPNFGANGGVDMNDSLGRKINPRHITHSSPVAICRDTVIVGSIIHDAPLTKEAPPGHVRGFDVRTGIMKWIFHTIPQEGEFGVDTWEDGAWKYTGATNVWSMMSVDDELGYVYLPVATPTNDMYGGHRLGNDLFAESLVCLNAETGERVWHFQAVHHGLWDYDFPTAPVLADIQVNGKTIKAVAQVSKQAFTYVFDRVTGGPVWPIVEREVPQSTVEGERSSPTQPFPTKPAPFDRQGVTENDLIDFTPELRQEALDIVKKFTLGPVFTPPVTEETSLGVIQVPGTGGGANWPGAALDPESNILYIPSRTGSSCFPLVKPDPSRSNFHYVLKSWLNQVPGPQGLPLLKPPYARVTAIDLNTGEHVWMTPNGVGPRNHPALKDLNLPPLGTSSGGPLVTKTLLLVTQSRGDGEENSPRINVFNKKSGELLGHIELPENPFGNPMTYMHEGKQYICVAVGGGPFFAISRAESEAPADTSFGDKATLQALSSMPGAKPELVAFRLPG